LLCDRPDATRWDLELLTAGRQLCAPGGARVIVGRNSEHNTLLESLAGRSDARRCTLLRPHNFPGPTALVVDAFDAATTRWAAHEILARSRHFDACRAELQMETSAGFKTVAAANELPQVPSL
jgi:hypothetical protein